MAGEKEKEVTTPPAVEAVIEKANKGEKLSKEEETVLLQSEGAVPGYVNEAPKEPVKEKTPEEIASEKEAKDKEEKAGITAEDREKYKGKTDEEIVALKKAPAKKEGEEETKDPIFLRLETELAKPEGQENLEDLSKEAKAYFYQMKKDRKARQEAEKDADAAKFELIKIKKAAPEKKEDPPEDPLKELKEKDPGDFMTVADVLKVVEGLAKPAPKKDEGKPKGADAVSRKFFVMCDNEARSKHPEDYDSVMELTPDIVDKNEQYQMKVAQAWVNGENPAEVMYDIIKGDPEFAKLFPAAEIRFKAKAAATKKPEKEEKKVTKTPEELAKEKAAKEAEEALEGNEKKSKTTAHVTTGDGIPAGELTLEAITSMSDKEFRELPKKVRDAYLKKYGA